MKHTELFVQTIDGVIWHATHLIDNSYEFYRYMDSRDVIKLKRTRYETFTY